jgi:hypothetical protein
MTSFIRFTCPIVTVLAVLWLSGCATPGSLVPQQSTADDARSRVGLPTDIRFSANGDELWEYARGPAGMQTDVVRIGRDGRVEEVTQLLTPERFDRIVVGKTTKQQMRELLGRPSDLRYLPSGLVWEWRARVGPENGHYAVRFDNANVVREKMVLTDPHSDDGKGDSGK